MTTVILDGVLGKKFGKEWKNIHCNTPKKALQVVSANVDGLYEFIRKNINTYAGYAVIVDGKEYDTDQYLLDRRQEQPKTIRFVPLVAGAGGFFRGIFGRVVMAVAICVAAHFTAGAAAAAIGEMISSSGVAGAGAAAAAAASGASAAQTIAIGTAGLTAAEASVLTTTINMAFANATIAGFSAATVSAGASLAMSIGISMAMGAAVGMLTKQASMSNKDYENSSDKTSHYFDGAVNTEKQGVAIPLIYGTVLTGSHPISVHLEVSDT